MQNFTVLCSIVVGILSIGYPLLLQIISRYDVYKSPRISDLLKKDRCLSCFRYNLFITTALMILILTITNLFDFLANNFECIVSLRKMVYDSSSMSVILIYCYRIAPVIFFSFTVLLLIMFFLLVRRLMKFYSSKDLNKILEENYKKNNKKNGNKKKDALIAIFDLLVYAINSNDDNIIEKNVKFLTDALAEERNQYAKLHKNDKTIKYIYEFAYEDYVYENILRLCRIVAENKVTNVTVYNFLFNLEWLFPENKYHFISTKTFNLLIDQFLYFTDIINNELILKSYNKYKSFFKDIEQLTNEFVTKDKSNITKYDYVEHLSKIWYKNDFKEKRKSVTISCFDMLESVLSSNNYNYIDIYVELITEMLSEERNQYAEQNKNDNTDEYIYEFVYEDYIYDNIFRICFYIEEKTIKNQIIEDFIYDLEWLFSEDRYHFISVETIKLIKEILVILIENKRNKNILKINKQINICICHENSTRNHFFLSNHINSYFYNISNSKFHDNIRNLQYDFGEYLFRFKNFECFVEILESDNWYEKTWIPDNITEIMEELIKIKNLEKSFFNLEYRKLYCYLLLFFISCKDNNRLCDFSMKKYRLCCEIIETFYDEDKEKLKNYLKENQYLSSLINKENCNIENKKLDEVLNEYYECVKRKYNSRIDIFDKQLPIKDNRDQDGYMIPMLLKMHDILKNKYSMLSNTFENNKLYNEKENNEKFELYLIMEKENIVDCYNKEFHKTLFLRFDYNLFNILCKNTTNIKCLNDISEANDFIRIFEKINLKKDEVVLLSLNKFKLNFEDIDNIKKVGENHYKFKETDILVFDTGSSIYKLFVLDKKIKIYDDIFIGTPEFIKYENMTSSEKKEFDNYNKDKKTHVLMKIPLNCEKIEKIEYRLYKFIFNAKTKHSNH